MRLTLDIKKTIRGSVPRLPFEGIARKALPKGYHLSLVICGDMLSRSLNKKYRGKTYFPNVLSFPIDKREGEIFLNIRKAAREARIMRVTLTERLALLFVHGCFHLRGLHHGLTMEREEARVLRAFGHTWHGASTRE